MTETQCLEHVNQVLEDMLRRLDAIAMQIKQLAPQPVPIKPRRRRLAKVLTFRPLNH